MVKFKLSSKNNIFLVDAEECFLVHGWSSPRRILSNSVDKSSKVVISYQPLLFVP